MLPAVLAYLNKKKETVNNITTVIASEMIITGASMGARLTGLAKDGAVVISPVKSVRKHSECYATCTM